MSGLRTLAETIGRPAPACLEAVWLDGAGGLEERDCREAVLLISLLFKGAWIRKDLASKKIQEWHDQAPGICALDPLTVVQNEIDRAYSSSEAFSCKLIQRFEYIRGCCDRGGCLVIDHKWDGQAVKTSLDVTDAIKALDAACDHATSKDGQGFSKFDREEYGCIIDKARSGDNISQKEEKTAYRFLKKYKKQLKGLYSPTFS
jgi:hypothetical protein